MEMLIKKPNAEILILLWRKAVTQTEVSGEDWRADRPITIVGSNKELEKVVSIKRHALISFNQKCFRILAFIVTTYCVH